MTHEAHIVNGSVLSKGKLGLGVSDLAQITDLVYEPQSVRLQSLHFSHFPFASLTVKVPGG